MAQHSIVCCGYLISRTFIVCPRAVRNGYDSCFDLIGASISSVAGGRTMSMCSVPQQSLSVLNSTISLGFRVLFVLCSALKGAYKHAEAAHLRPWA